MNSKEVHDLSKSSLLIISEDLDNINELNKDLIIIPMADIKSYQNDECSKSDFVMKQFGVKGVCEPTALIANGKNSHLIFKKTAYDGVTIAVSLKD